MNIVWCILLAGFIAHSSSQIIKPSLQLEVASKQTDSITIRWNVTDFNNTVESYEVYANDSSGDYHVTMTGSDMIDIENREATIDLREPDEQYNVCLKAKLTKNASDELKQDSVVVCEDTATIKKMRLSSILALVGVLGFFLLCVLVGYCAWKCAASRSKGDEHDYEKSDVNGNGDIVPLTQIED